MTSVNQIRLIEELAMNAWPAETIQIVDGWRLRFNHGVSRRTNSVWPNEWAGRIPLAVKMELAAEFYQRRGLPSRFQVCPASLPEGLDDVLESQGYRLVAPTMVQTAPVEAVLQATRAPRRRVQVSEGLDETWFQAYSRFGSYSSYDGGVVRNSLARTGPRAAYALIRAAGRPVAVGRCVLERGWLGIFAMATEPRYRRQGFATAILHEMVAWGAQNGTENLYLQVELQNQGAQALYTGAGFSECYRYHYRERPMAS